MPHGKYCFILFEGQDVLIWTFSALLEYKFICLCVYFSAHIDSLGSLVDHQILSDYTPTEQTQNLTFVLACFMLILYMGDSTE